ncbi:transposase [Pantoea coffeiphila]|uniref:transposase n=1 Tax=Pantoea coffeiphila TaxID=1465635 RepID=UPI001960D301|nr:transposase [Pantoea coffeiphila]MBM7341258.1 putative transposase [Pantoea coffeiphila]
MNHIEEIEFIHKTGDVLYPTKITQKSSGKTAFHLKPLGLDKTTDLIEVEDASEAIRLVVEGHYSIRCKTLIATVRNKKGQLRKREGMYSINGRNITKYNLRSR